MNTYEDREDHKQIALSGRCKLTEGMPFLGQSNDVLEQRDPQTTEKISGFLEVDRRGIGSKLVKQKRLSGRCNYPMSCCNGRYVTLGVCENDPQLNLTISVSVNSRKLCERSLWNCVPPVHLCHKLKLF